jgi:hypothetical protein
MREPKQDIALDTNTEVVNQIKQLTDKIWHNLISLI